MENVMSVANLEGKPRVLAVVPRDFMLRLDDHRVVKFSAGVQSVPARLLEHWYVQAHGVAAAPEPKAAKSKDAA